LAPSAPSRLAGFFSARNRSRDPKVDFRLEPKKSIPMERLKRRTDFRAAAKGARAPGAAFVLQALKREDQGGVRVGFTVSKQVGNAVERNRVRRRLREVVRLAAKTELRTALCAGHDYVLIGRRAALKTAFGDLMRDFGTALDRIHRSTPAHRATGMAAGRPLHEAGSPSQPRPANKPAKGVPKKA
jgi:ribonuclease P protein component